MDVLTTKQVRTLFKKNNAILRAEIAELRARLDALSLPKLNRDTVEGIRKSSLVADMSIFDGITDDDAAA